MQQSLTNVSVLPEITVAETAMPGEAGMSAQSLLPGLQRCVEQNGTL